MIAKLKRAQKWVKCLLIYHMNALSKNDIYALKINTFYTELSNKTSIKKIWNNKY